jgi:choline kinase
MEAIILAAGVGSRLAPITNELPKALVPVNSKPILQYQIESYLEADIKKIYIVVGYKGEQIENFINNKYPSQLNCFHVIRNTEYKITNNMYSLYLALKIADSQSIIISNADVVVKKDMVTRILDYNAESGIAFQPENHNDESMKVSIDNNNCVFRISKQITKENSNGTSIDFYKFSGKGKEELIKEVINTIEVKKDYNSWTEVAINNILHYRHIKGINIGNDFWYEIDNFEDLKNAEKLLN